MATDRVRKVNSSSNVRKIHRGNNVIYVVDWEKQNQFHSRNRHRSLEVIREIIKDKRVLLHLRL